MKNYLKIIIFLGIVTGIVIITALMVFPDKVNQLIFKEEIATIKESSQENIEQKVVLIIDDSEGTPKTFEAEFKEGMTAFDLLKNEMEKINTTLKTKTYDIGVFIEVIGDKENGQDGKYWLYYVNGEMPMVAADKYELKIGDKVEFKFEKSPF